MNENNRELILTRTFNATIDKVFKAWTDPEELAKWWGPNGVTNPTCEIDVRPGGAINIVMLAGKELGELAGQEWPTQGKYIEIISPTKLVYTASAVMNGEPVMDSLNTVTFEDLKTQTKVTLNVKITRFTPAAKGALAGMEMGWNQSLDKLVGLFS